MAYAEILRANSLDGVEAEVTSQAGDEQQKFSMQAFGAHFVEVRVDEAIERLHITRMVGAFGIGRVLNPRTAQSQGFGGMVWGVGQALLEETHLDHHFGRYQRVNLLEVRQSPERVPRSLVQGGSVDRCGHFIPDERPHYLIETLLNFFNQLQ